MREKTFSYKVPLWFSLLPLWTMKLIAYFYLWRLERDIAKHFPELKN